MLKINEKNIELKTTFYTFTCVTIVALLFFCFGFTLSQVQPAHPNFHLSFLKILITNSEIAVNTLFLEFLTFGLYSLTYLFNQFFSLGIMIGGLIKQYSWVQVTSFFWIHGLPEVIGMIITASIVPNTIILMWNKYVLKRHCFIYRTTIILFFIMTLLIILAAFLETFIAPYFVIKLH